MIELFKSLQFLEFVFGGGVALGVCLGMIIMWLWFNEWKP
jgi:hypothetical protein